MEVLNKPYPFDGRLGHTIKVNAFIGLFVAMFLIVFEPFGTSLWQTEFKTLKLLGYGILAFVVPTILYICVKWYMDKHRLDQHYKVKHEMLWYLMVLLCIAMANCLYISYLHDVKFSFMLFKYGVFMVMAIGFFPILVGVIVKYNHYLALNTKEAEVLEDLVSVNQLSTQPSQSMFTLTAENGKDRLEMETSDLVYVESLENYVKVYYHNGNGIENKVLRSTLAKIESQIQESFIIRCHRSFIANLHKVTHFSGNAQGYLMTFDEIDVKIPVSRSYGVQILEKMKELGK